MSARKLTGSSQFGQPVTVAASQTTLELSPDQCSIHKVGIEFRSPTAFKAWSEMTIALDSPQHGGKVNCSGVVIACNGNKHTGFNVSLLFTSLTPQAEQRLQTLARSTLGLS